MMWAVGNGDRGGFSVVIFLRQIRQYVVVFGGLSGRYCSRKNTRQQGSTNTAAGVSRGTYHTAAAVSLLSSEIKYSRTWYLLLLMVAGRVPGIPARYVHTYEGSAWVPACFDY